MDIIAVQNQLDEVKRSIIPWIIAIAMFMEGLDSTIVSVAIPRIAHDFSINPVNLKLALTSYLLSLAIFIPVSGWFADKYGAKKIFISAMSIFTLGSLCCAFSFNLPTLVAARLLQGFGGALMMPVGRLIMMRLFSKMELVKAMSALIIPGLVGPALGPTLGGLILHIASWHWIFLVNLPFGLLGALIAFILLTDPAKPEKVVAFNWLGFLLFSSALTLITSAMACLGDNFDLAKVAALMAIGGATFLIVYAYVSARQESPLLDLSLFKKSTFAVSMGVNFFIRIGTGALPFLLPLLLQMIWGRSALFSGILFMFFALGMLSGRALVSDKILFKLKFRSFLTITSIMLCLLSMNLAWFGKATSPALLALILFVIGALTTQMYMSFGILYRLELIPSQFSQAASIASTVQQFSAGCGIAIAAIILHAVSAVSGHAIFSKTVFSWTFISLGVLGLISLIFVSWLEPDLKLKADA